jgi:uncharacterized membrane protein
MNLYSPSYAIYLPAVNTGYVSTVASPLPQGRRFPSGLTPKDLMFWEPNNNWHYPYVLHSIGQYSVSKAPHVAMNKASRTNSILVGDSGGYQIGAGTLKGLNYVKNKRMKGIDALVAWRRETVAREWIESWLSSECDYAMTIDMPLWAQDKKGENSPFHLCSSEQLIAMTDQNLRYIDAFSPPHVKWLNVIQGGQTVVDAIAWWDQVKWFRKGGWAMAGSAGMAGGLFNMLAVLLMMRDDNAFEAGQDWLHVLGVSTPFWAVALTAIQEGLRNTNPELKVSFDSSSPFLDGGRFEDVALTPAFGNSTSSWTIKKVNAPQQPSYADNKCTLPFPHKQSPLGKVLMMNELNVQAGIWQKRQYDSLSNALLTNHNIWVYLDAFKQANDIVAIRDVNRIPADYLQCFDLIKHLFSKTGDWTVDLESNKALLDKVAPYCL